MKKLLALCSLVGLGIAGCGMVTSTTKSVFVLVDVSGTYARNIDSAILSTRVLTSKLQTNDWIGFAQISSCSFSDDGLVVREKLPGIPSRAASAKTRIFARLDSYANAVQPTAYTDIKGALRYAVNELDQSGSASKYIIVFSDMIEDVSAECATQDLSMDLSGYTVVAANVTKSKADERDPQSYFDRLDAWREFVESSGGTWRIAADGNQISEIIG